MSARKSSIQAIAFACALLVSVGTAHAAKGEFSIGGVFGVGFYSGGSLNDSLEAAGYKKVSEGWEYGGSLRYALSPKISLDAEVLSINGKGTTDSVTPKFQAEVNGIAAPLSLYYAISENDNSALSLFVGAGPMFKTGWSTSQEPNETDSKNTTAFYGHAGIEGQWRMSHTLALTTSALARIAKAKDVEQSDDPLTKLDVSMDGFALNLGLRAFFGGAK